MKVPLIKVEIDKDTIKAANQALKSGNWILGKKTVEFEKKFAKYCNVKHAVCVSSGTTALFLSMKALGVKKDDEIIVPSFSFIATASTVSMCDAIPKFVDVDQNNFTINPKEIESKITKKTVGILPVHLFGHPFDMDPIKKIARKNSLFVLEDAAQAHGAEYKGKSIGGFGDAACFSFYPSKNLTVCGDGGMITSNDSKFIEKIKMLRDHGRKARYEHTMVGYNFRMGEINASMGLVRLKKLNQNNSKRRKIASKYDKKLKNVKKPVEESWAKHVYHQYSILTKSRKQLLNYLSSNNIGAMVYYPIPIHKQPMYKKSNKEKLPITEKLSEQIISIPMFPSMTEVQQNHVISKINEFSSKNV